jgi:hypothetical protein
MGAEQRKAYHAGYSDSWHGYHYGSGQENPGDAYAVGWNHAIADKEAA